MHYDGIDISKNCLDLCVLDEKGNRVLEDQLANNETGYDELSELVEPDTPIGAADTERSCSITACAEASAGDAKGSGGHWAQSGIVGGSGQLNVQEGEDFCTFGLGYSCSTEAYGVDTPGRTCTTATATTEVWGGDSATAADTWGDCTHGVGELMDMVSDFVGNTTLPPGP